MKHLATFLYWLAAVFALALILVSFDYRFGRALFLATSLLPGMFCAKFFLPMALRAERRRVLAVICVVASTLIIEWMSLLLASFHTTPSENLMRAPFPGLFLNPVFILIPLVAIVVPGELLSHYLKKKLSEERYVTFISDRRKVVLPIEAILYVESNDKEVLLHTQEGSYRTRTCISQWAERLDDRFVRIHRAYLINIGHVSSWTPTQVTVQDRVLDISRTYRGSVAARFVG